MRAPKGDFVERVVKMFGKKVVYLYGNHENVDEVIKALRLVAGRFDVNVEVDLPARRPPVIPSGIIDAEATQKEHFDEAMRALGDDTAERKTKIAVLMDRIKESQRSIDESVREIVENYKEMMKP